MALLNKLAECDSAGGVVFKDGFVVNALRELSIGLCRGNCVLYKRSLYALALASGNASRAGADIPTSKINQGYFLTLSIDCLSASPWCCSFTFSMLYCTLTGSLTALEYETSSCYCLLGFHILYALTHTHTDTYADMCCFLDHLGDHCVHVQHLYLFGSICKSPSFV